MTFILIYLFAEDTTFSQPVDCHPKKYSPTKKYVSKNWMGESGCTSKISFTTLHFFLKDYLTYGIAISIVVTFYTALSITLVTCGKSYSSLHTGAPFFVWNVIASIFSMYCMFKSMQYYPKPLKGHPDIECQVDSIDEKLEKVIEYCVYASFIVLFGGWILGIFRCWINRRVIASGIRRTHRIKSIIIMLEKCELLIAVILAITFFVVVMYSSGLMIKTRLDEDRWGADSEDIMLLILVDLLAVMSMIDIHFFEFCRNTRKHYCGKSRAQRRKDEFLTHFGSFHDIRPTGNDQGDTVTPLPLVTSKKEQQLEK